MTALAVLPLLASLASAQTPAAAVERVMKKADAIVATQKGKDAREIAEGDRKAEELGRELKPLGWRAAPALGAAASVKGRAMKVRLLAVSFLGLLQDPAAFEPLEKIARDPDQDPGVRAVAAQSLASQKVPDAALRRAVCSLLDLKDLPREAAENALSVASKLGCPDAASLFRLARSFGARPAAKDLQTVVAPALAALGRSRGDATAKALLDLIAYFPPLGEPRAAAIQALDARRDDIAVWHAPEALPVLVDALRTESDRVDTMLALVRAATAVGEPAVPALSRLSKHPDAEVLVCAAETAAAFKRVEILPDLEAVVAGAMIDPRFSPKEGRPDPAALLARLEKVVDALKREKTAR